MCPALLPRPVTDDSTRRQFLTALAATGLLAGCGGGPTTDAPATGEHSAVDDRGVTVALDRAPTRVSTVYDALDVQNVLAVGLVPVSADISGTRPNPWVGELLAGVTDIPTTDGVNVEAIAAARPELIVTAYYDEQTFPLLDRVAPLFVIPDRVDWREQAAAVGAVTWREAQARAAVSAAEEALARGRAALADRAGEQLAAIYTFNGEPNEVAICNRSHGLGTTLEALGMTPLPEVTEPGKVSRYVSVEEVTQVTGDRLLVLDFDYDQPAFAPTSDALLASELGARIPAAAGGVLRMSKAATQASYLITALSVPYLVDELVTLLR